MWFTGTSPPALKNGFRGQDGIRIGDIKEIFDAMTAKKLRFGDNFKFPLMRN